MGGNTIDFIPKKTDPSVALKEYVKASKPPVSKNTAFISTATSPSHSHKTRTSITNHPDIHASSSNVAAVINIKPTHSDNNTNNNRRKRSYSTSTGTSAATYSSSSSPPSSIVDARRSSLNGWQWALKEVDENEATLQDCHDDEGDDNVTSCKKKSKSTQEKRKSNDSDLTGIKSNKRRKVGAGEAEGRDRSSSSSGSSSSSTTPSNNTTTTILDPEFHFPQASLEASINLHKVLTLRKRKRSSSYVKNSDLLLGKYLENNQKDQTLMTLPNNDGCGVGTGDGSGDGNGSGDGSGRRILANSILLEEDDEGRETAMAPEKKFMKLIRVQGPSGWLDA